MRRQITLDRTGWLHRFSWNFECNFTLGPHSRKWNFLTCQSLSYYGNGNAPFSRLRRAVSACILTNFNALFLKQDSFKSKSNHMTSKKNVLAIEEIIFQVSICSVAYVQLYSVRRVLPHCKNSDFCLSLERYISHGNATFHKACITEITLWQLNRKIRFKTWAILIFIY